MATLPPVHMTNRCPVRTTMELVGGKWKLALLALLREEPKRWSALKQGLPDISEKMLTQELKHLVESRLIDKEAGLYQLTPQGQHAFPLLEAMVTFAQAYTQEMEQSGGGEKLP